MTTNVQRREHTPPPPLDEGYWAALLREGEFAEPVPPEQAHTGDTEADDEMPDEVIQQQSEPAAQSDWIEIQRIMENDEVVELQAIGYNRGGLLVEWRSLRGFVPASQLVDFPSTSNDFTRKRMLMSRIGTSMVLRVIELSEEQNRLILSERAAQAQPGERADILTRLRSGDYVEGVVTNLCDFGAFVDLGGLEGLIHISELSWGRVGHPAEILERGAEVRAYVLEVNRDAGRIALSLKRLHPDPWETVQQRYQIGEMVEGVITNVVDFGAFARIEEGLEGLIHVSELAEGHFLHPRNVVSEGQQVSARILSIDGHARRLGLSLREPT
ncbi:MAG: S1 RNA-binding domain-containing protein [Chloroflexi bacterium]|nr:S1 RNA-binding domain-containing protein [Chloroflexota bacterium]